MRALYRVGRISGWSRIAHNTVSITLCPAKSLRAEPGQYVMLWIPRVGEIPLAVASLKKGHMRLIVAKKGRVTGYIHQNIGSMDKLLFRGPYGSGYSVNVDKALLIGGGYGSASLLFLAEVLGSRNAEITTLLGFRRAEDAILTEDFSRYSSKLLVSTEDGSLGFRGTVVQLATRVLRGSKDFDKVFICGPESMEAKLLRIALESGLEAEISLERLIKCAVGLCGACTLEPLGLLVCKDGPVFSSKILEKIEDFGRYWHDSYGRRVPITNFHP